MIFYNKLLKHVISKVSSVSNWTVNVKGKDNNGFEFETIKLYNVGYTNILSPPHRTDDTEKSVKFLTLFTHRQRQYGHLPLGKKRKRKII